MVRVQAPQLLLSSGCGTLTAAKLLAKNPPGGSPLLNAKLARLAGVAPIPASSGASTRLRLLSRR